MTGREPPMANVEAEAALLGALMTENHLIDRAADIIRTEDFAEAVHGRIFAALMKEHDEGHNANPITLRPYFTDDPAMSQLGGPAYLAQLTGSGIAVIGALDFARQISELATRRRLAEQMGLLSRAAENYEISLDQLGSDFEAAGADLIKGSEGASTLSGAECIERALGAMVEDQPPGVSCRIIPSLDHVLGTIRPGFLVILAGRPGMGKTATALSYAHGAAEQGHGVLVASLEMRADDLGARLACDVAYSLGEPVPYSKVTDGGATPEQRRQIARAALLVREWPLWIEDLPSATIGRLASIVRRQARRFKAKGQTLQLVIVDYLQLLRPNDKEKDLYQAISAVSRGLKALAKAEGVGIMALCQLSRDVEKRDDKTPRTDDLRDSGQIEQDADTICLLLRQEEYLYRKQPRENGPKWDEWQDAIEKVRGRIDFIVPKRRFGRPGTGRGNWYGKFQAVRG